LVAVVEVVDEDEEVVDTVVVGAAEALGWRAEVGGGIIESLGATEAKASAL